MTLSKNCYQVIIPNWQNHYLKSEKTAVKYWLFKDIDKLPEKYKKEAIAVPLTIGKKHYCSNNKFERFIKNSKKQGKPNVWIVNGQGLYSGTLNWRLRKNITKFFHEYFSEYIKDQLTPIILPVGKFLSISCDIYEIKRGQIPDVSNMWPLIKWFEDSLQECEMIKNDNPNYVQESGRLKYHWVNDVEDRKLVFTIQII